MSNQLPPITPEGLGGLLLWLAKAKSGQPDHELLLRGLPQGRIRRARVTDDGAIAVTFIDQRHGQERSERLFDPEAFFVLRLLFVAKTHVRVDRNMPDRHYVTIFGDITALRVIADAQRDQQANQIDDHYNLRRSNLVLSAAVPGPKKRPVHQSREHVTNFALTAFDNLSKGSWLRRPFGVKTSRGCWRKGFAS